MGPPIPQPIGHQIHRRGALMSTDVILRGKRQRLPKACARYVLSKTGAGARFRTVVPGGPRGELRESTQLDLSRGCDIVKTSKLSRSSGKVVHLLKFHPRFEVVGRSRGNIRLADRSARQSLTLSSPGARKRVSRQRDHLAVECLFGKEGESALSY